MKSKFDYAINFTLLWEAGRNRDGTIREDGGLVTDTGGVTKWGISTRANPTTDIQALTKEQAMEIYRTKYWNPYSLDKYELGLAVSWFDAGVNCGPNRAKQWYLKVEHTKDPAKRIIELRDAHYFNLVSLDQKKYGKYLKGWTSRTNDLKKYIDIIRLETATHKDPNDPNASASSPSS